MGKKAKRQIEMTCYMSFVLRKELRWYVVDIHVVHKVCIILNDT